MKDDKNKKDLEEQNEQEESKDTEQVEELTQKLEEADLKYKRALADYQNLQKRVSEEKSEWIKSANKDLLVRLLPVLDTLMLAEKHLKDQGLAVSISHFLDILKAEGVVKIKTVGEDFDPMQMECVMTEEGKENKVLEELRAGYMLYDKVLRPAQVKVGKE